MNANRAGGAKKNPRSRRVSSFRERIATAEVVDAARDLRVTRSDTRARLLAAALERFASVGFSETTMRDLGADVGIKAPAIYSHFKSKEEILGLALIWAMDDFNAAVLHPGEDELDPVEHLRRILARHITYQMENPIVARAFDVLETSKILERLGQSDYHEEVIKRLRVYVSTVRKLIEEITTRQSGNTVPRLAAHAITTMYDQVGRWHQSNSKDGDTDVIEAYWGFVCKILQISEKNKART